MSWKFYNEIPPKFRKQFEQGLVTRTGGVLRDKASGQIVAHLRDAGSRRDGRDLLNTPISFLMRRGGMSTAATNLALVGTMGTLNLALGACTLIFLATRIRDLDTKITEIGDQIGAEFARDRLVSMESALECVQDLIEARDDTYRKQSAALLNDRLTNAKNQLLFDVRRVFADDGSNVQIEIALDFLLQAMQVDTMRIRSYLEVGESDLAKNRLRECIESYTELTRELVGKLLGESRAKYFNEKVNDDDLSAYIEIERWLRGKDDVILELITEHRTEFWNSDAIRELTRGPSLFFQESHEPTQHLIALAQAQILIENVRRLNGLEMEVAAMRLSLEDWDALSGDNDKDFGIVVDQSYIDDIDDLDEQDDQDEDLEQQDEQDNDKGDSLPT